MKEMQDPANRAEYEREIAKYEAQVVCELYHMRGSVFRQNKIAFLKTDPSGWLKTLEFLRPPKTLGKIHSQNRQQRKKRRKLKSWSNHKPKANRLSKETDEIFKIRDLLPTKTFSDPLIFFSQAFIFVLYRIFLCLNLKYVFEIFLFR